MSSKTEASRGGAILWRLLPWALLLVVIAPHLPYPLDEDQAFTLIGASAIDRGAVLYVDYWDIRQPGAIWCYWIAGRLFGFTEIGVHVFEAAWLIGAAVFAWLTVRRVVTTPAVAACAPLFTIGVYYAWATPWPLAQPESFALLPLACCLWLAAAEPATGTGEWRRWALYGLSFALLVSIKLLLAMIPFVLLVIALATGRPRSVRRAAIALTAAGAGTLLPIAGIAAAFWRRGALGDLYWATFVAPVATVAETPRAPWHRLATSAGTFVKPWLGAAHLFLGLAAGGRLEHDRHAGPASASAPARRLCLLLIGWTMAGLTLVLVQRIHFWAYHFIPLVIPVGLLAVMGIDRGVRLIGHRLGASTAAAVLALPLVATMAAPLSVKLLALWDASSSAAWRADYQERVAPGYAAVRRAAAVVARSPHPGTVVVFGDPRVQLYTGRPQAIPLRTSTLYSVLQRHWDVMPELMAQSAPAFVYFTTASVVAVADRAPQVSQLIASAYTPIWNDANGIWYERSTER
jgi:hypothetical protein